MGQVYYAPIVIDHTKVPNTDQTDFPVLVSGTFAGAAGIADLRSVANGGHVNNGSGYDIAFYSDSGLTSILKWEIEKYVATTGQIIFWVKVPSISHTADTTIYIAYGDPTISTDQSDKNNVYDSHFIAVYHLGDGSTVDLTDSTASPDNGTNNGTTAAAGQISGAAAFASASSQDVGLGTTADFNLSGDITIEAWIKGPLESTYRAIAVRQTTTVHTFYFYLNSNELRWFDGLERSSGNSIGANVWAHVAATRTGTTLKMYFNGVQTSSGNITVATATSDASKTANIGSNGGVNQYFNGSIDEVRFSNSVRTADWLLTCVNNQTTPGTFLTVGTEVPLISPALTVTISDTLSLSDAFRLVEGDLINFTDVIVFDDSFATDFTFTRILSDALSFTDSLALFASAVLELADTLNINDALRLVNNIFLPPFTDSYTIADNLRFAIGLLAIVGDILNSWGDNLLVAAWIDTAASDTLVFTDNLDSFIATKDGLGDAYTVLDNLALILGLSVSKGDSYTITDSLILTLSSFLQESLSDQFSLTDGVSVRLSTADDNYYRHYLNDIIR